MKKSVSRMLYFDGLRGLMALIVAYGHFFGQTKLFMLDNYKESIPSTITKFYTLTETTPFIFSINGNFATTVFFILSGCVLLNAFKANETFIGALIRRFLRLGIPVFLSCLVGYLMLRYGLRDDYTGVYSLNDVIKQGILTLYTSDFYTRFLNPVIWSMSTEFIGSVILLIVTRIGIKNNSHGLLFLFIMTLLTYGYYVFFIMIGAWISLIFSNEKFNDKLNKKNSLFTFFLIIIIIFLQSCPSFHPWDKLFIPEEYFVKPLINLGNFSIPGMYAFHNYELVRGFGGIFLLILVMSRIKVREFLSKGLVQFFGKISFSLYLIHWLILSSITMPVNRFVFNYTHNVYIAISSSFMLYIGATIILSMLYYKIVEKNAINFSREAGVKIDKFILNMKI